MFQPHMALLWSATLSSSPGNKHVAAPQPEPKRRGGNKHVAAPQPEPKRRGGNKHVAAPQPIQSVHRNTY